MVRTLSLSRVLPGDLCRGPARARVTRPARWSGGGVRGPVAGYRAAACAERRTNWFRPIDNARSSRDAALQGVPAVRLRATSAAIRRWPWTVGASASVQVVRRIFSLAFPRRSLFPAGVMVGRKRWRVWSRNGFHGGRGLPYLRGPMSRANRSADPRSVPAVASCPSRCGQCPHARSMNA